METNDAEQEYAYEIANDMADGQGGELEEDEEANYIQVQTDEDGNLLQDEHGNLVQYVPMEEGEEAEGEEEGSQPEVQGIQHQRVERIIDENGEVHHVLVQDGAEYSEAMPESGEAEEGAGGMVHALEDGGENEQVMLMNEEEETAMIDENALAQVEGSQPQQMVYVVRAASGQSTAQQIPQQKSKIVWLSQPNMAGQTSQVVASTSMPQTIQKSQPRVIQLGNQTILLQQPSAMSETSQQPQQQKFVIRPQHVIHQQQQTASPKPQIYYVKQSTNSEKPQMIEIISNQQPIQVLKSPQRIAPRLMPITSTANATSFQAGSTNQQTVVTMQGSAMDAVAQYVKQTQRQMYQDEYSELEKPIVLSSKKPCNCTKSQCLKLYCDCFANGEFCQNCNCVQCYNNLGHEEERSLAVKLCIERNPNAFHPKIGKYKPGDKERRHTKGCNCKKSGCLKNYCECYEARILCSAVCRCVGCHNIEENMDAESLLTIKQDFKYPQPKSKFDETLKRLAGVGEVDAKKTAARVAQSPQPELKISSELIDATCECLLSRAAETPDEQAEKAILEEFGHCLSAIIKAANSRTECDKSGRANH